MKTKDDALNVVKRWYGDKTYGPSINWSNQKSFQYTERTIAEWSGRINNKLDYVGRTVMVESGLGG